MQVPDTLLSLFNARVEKRGNSYVVEIPKSEVENGAIEPSEVYRIGLLQSEATGNATYRASDGYGTAQLGRGHNQAFEGEPPVEEGEIIDVEISDMGDEGDGIARTEEGYVIFVPETEVGDEVTVEVSRTLPNTAFGEVVGQSQSDEEEEGEGEGTEKTPKTSF